MPNTKMYKVGTLSGETLEFMADRVTDDESGQFFRYLNTDENMQDTCVCLVSKSQTAYVLIEVIDSDKQ